MKWIYPFFLTLFIFLVTSCKQENLIQRNSKEHAVLVFMPWTDNLTTFLLNNLKDMESGLAGSDMEGVRLIVCMQNPATQARIFEIIKQDDGSFGQKTLTVIQNPHFKNVDELTRLFQTMKSYANAKTYSMIIGGHGMGWIPASSDGLADLKRKSSSSAELSQPVMHWDYTDEQGLPLTRYFGGTTFNHKIEMNTLRQALQAANIKLNYLMFDDCFMANVEVAYTLRDVTDYLIGCPTEIPAFGFPYARVISNLVFKEDYNQLVNDFINFYSTYQLPMANIGVIKTAELETLAGLMKTIHGKYSKYFDSSKRQSVQMMDGYFYSYAYNATLFFDLGDYVNKLCPDEALRNQFHTQLAKVVPFKAHTPYFFAFTRQSGILVREYSGITTSVCSNASLAKDYASTDWYKATH